MPPRLPVLGETVLPLFLERIRILYASMPLCLYASMDEAYAAAAERTGFECRGFSQSCCEERFYHYTFAEHFFFLEGLRPLDKEPTARILDGAREAVP